MNWKKALAAGTLAVAAVTMIAGCGGNTDKQAAQKLPDKIVIGLDDNFPPMGFRDDSGQLVGFDIDLAQEASKRLGIPVEFKPIDWDSKEAALKSKQVDMLWNGLTITDERAQQIAFSKPYMNNAQLLVVRADDRRRGRNGGAARGKHRIENDNKAVGDVFGQLAVVFVRFKRHFVAVQTDVSDLGGGNKRKKAADHAESGTQDRNNGKLLAGDHLGLGGGDGRFDFHVFGRKIAKRFIAHQHGNFFDKLAELLASGAFVA